jgi:hypothetical protein
MAHSGDKSGIKVGAGVQQKVVNSLSGVHNKDYRNLGAARSGIRYAQGWIKMSVKWFSDLFGTRAEAVMQKRAEESRIKETEENTEITEKLTEAQENLDNLITEITSKKNNG